MMRSEVLAERLYQAWLDSDRKTHITSMWRHVPWLELDTDERNRWRMVAEAALSLTQTVEDWHGKAAQ